MWRLISRAFVVNAVVLFCSAYDGIGRIFLGSVPHLALSLFSVALSAAFLLLAVSLSYRLKAISDSYKKVNGPLGEDLNRKSVKDVAPKRLAGLIDRPFSNVVASVLFGGLLVIGLFSVAHDLGVLGL